MFERRQHLMPFGAEIVDAGGTRFRFWAPAAETVDLVIENSPARVPLPMKKLSEGWFELRATDIGVGARYRFAVNGQTCVPDPASRAQPDDVHGASEVIDPLAFEWSDGAWRGRPWEETVLYELHIGAFTPEGNFAGVMHRLDDLAELGVTAIELMPVADSPGRRNWGYDGCYPYAPEAAYGRPDALKALIDAAHARGIMVFLDVVYNHFGPEGNYLHLYAPDFFTDRYATPWGKAIDFACGGRPVRDFFIHNALYWIEEFNLDGLRLDAVHAIFDDSPKHILCELAERVLAQVGDQRHVHLVLENEKNEARYLERQTDGRPRWYVAQWNDDIHHAYHVLATGEQEGYYADYADKPMHHLARALTEGFVYQGEISPLRHGTRRGEPSADLPLTAFVSFLQNHDQIGNRAFGERISALAPADAIRALAAVLLLAPSPPLLFMGEEWDASQPFPFFCDFGPDLADSVREGRRREFAHFSAFQDEAALKRIPDPMADTTFESAVLDWNDRIKPQGNQRLAYYRELLRIRRREIVPHLAGLRGHAGDAELIGARGLSARWLLGDGAQLSLLANLGAEPAPGPSALPPGRRIFTTHAPTVKGEDMPPWSAAWLIEAGDRGEASSGSPAVAG